MGRSVKKKKKKQEHRLKIIRKNFYRSHLYRINVSYFDQFLFGGWQAYIENIHESIWIDRDRGHLIPILMKLFPLLLPIGDRKEQWHFWKIEFARRYRKRKHHGEPVGVAYIWWDGNDIMSNHIKRKIH